MGAKEYMAIEVDVRNLGVRMPVAPEVAAPAADVVLPRTARINLTLRRRRLRRVQQALEMTAWVAGTGVLLFFAAAGVLSLH
jgi:hypothetical protein